MRRSKTVLLSVVAATGLGLLLAWSQDWFRVTISGAVHPVGGDVAAGAIAALALTALALVAALALAGPVFRLILGGLTILVGSTVVLVTAFVLAEPVLAVSGYLSEQSGISGLASLTALVEAIEPTAWPFVAILTGGLLAAAGLGVIVSTSRWSRSGRRFARESFEAADGGSAIDEWDALSHGDDPTEEHDPPRRDR